MEAFKRDFLPFRLRLLILSGSQGNGKAERTSLTQSAFQLNAAPHQLDQPAADGKPKSGSLLLGRVSVGRLFKGAEYPVLLFPGNTGSRILHRKIEGTALIRGRRLFYGERDPSAFRREFHRIAQKIDQYLADPHSVSDKPAVRQINVLNETDALGRCLGQDQFTDRAQHFIHIEVKGFELHLAALDFGHIENIIDQSQQIIGRRLDFLQAVQNPLGGLILVQRNSRHTDNSVHGSSDLVAHPGEEFRLCPAGNIMLLLIELPLDHTSQLGQILIFPRSV